MSEETTFWAEQYADKVAKREKFTYLDRKIPAPKKWSVKSSSSLSGVLHIGRLSDVIRGEAVYRALKEIGFPAEFIYVTEDMDPLRSVPEGVPKDFINYIGHPVSDIPDPEGNFKSYAEKFTNEFLEVFTSFLEFEPKVHSMRDEYGKGNFTDSIITLVENADKARAIIEKVQGNSPKSWSPWKPICDKCGQLQTTDITGFENGKISYACRDYSFEKHTAKGCGYEGNSDLKKANGKLVWKSEWAAQWKRWNVCAEGAGKEYNAPNSSFFVNAKICEEILDFPRPLPVFYEHLLIGGRKMSASVGNVVYPAEWKEVSRPETLKLLYMKRIDKSRSFSWTDIPLLESELDSVAKAHFSKEGGKQTPQNKSLYTYSRIKGREIVEVPADYALVSALVQLFPDEKGVLGILKDMAHLTGKENREELSSLRERISFARAWVEKYLPAEQKLSFAEKIPEEANELILEAKPALIKLAEQLPKAESAEDAQNAVFESAKETGVSPRAFFKLLYFSLIGRERGPKMGSLIIALGKEKSLKRIKELADFKA